ncbi:MAG: amidohydrolase [Bacteroidales bacterium]|nr:amidohydrolase [Bacteroidales bacterium]
MKITLLQSDIIWEDKNQNFTRLERLLAEIPSGTDVVFMPEMFNTGFSMNPANLCEKPGSVSSDWLQKMATQYKIGIAGSYIVKEHGAYFNRWLFAAPDGNMWKYDKRHLFSPGNEHSLFSQGRERTVFTFKELRICPNVCYDLRFPVWSRCRNDYDLLINSANWPQSRRDVWITLLRARAIENQCYVAGVNRIGIDGTGISYCGDSMIIGPKGEVIASGDQDCECIISADLSLEELKDFRIKFPVLNDGDAFTLEI